MHEQSTCREPGLSHEIRQGPEATETVHMESSMTKLARSLHAESQYPPTQSSLDDKVYG
jgi:hypothetical protein